jgi:hypothetical protein
MPADQDKSAPARATEAQAKRSVLDWLDVIGKLVGAIAVPGAVLLVAYFGNLFQTRQSAVSIQSQREQAESQLRANMFSSLINPLAGPQSKDKSISADREELLTELLALNFYENFELKPLLEDVSNRLVAESKQKPNDAGTDPREFLWSTSRRISERERASIAWEWGGGGSAQLADLSGVCTSYWVTVTPPPEDGEGGKEQTGEHCFMSGYFQETAFKLRSPDGNYTLMMYLAKPNWKAQTVQVSTRPYPKAHENPQPQDIAYSFPLTWFDMPLTDNTLLPDGNRFAIYLRALLPPHPATDRQLADPGSLVIVVMWFPKGYFTPRERPLNYNDVQKLLAGKQQ